jgi:pimeloyl-ACP methyl ester carboxylesterase
MGSGNGFVTRAAAVSARRWHCKGDLPEDVDMKDVPAQAMAGLLLGVLNAPVSFGLAPSMRVAQVSAAQSSERSELVSLDVVGGRMTGRAYMSMEANSNPALVVVLHGDLLEPGNTYHYGFARTMASETPNIVAVGLLRPGYSDERGNRSDGDALTATGDNYTAEVVAAVAAATEQLKSRYRARTVILVGHSGGAAIAALLLGQYPDVFNASLLVACPCDVPAWRKYMMSVRGNPIWQRPHRGLSPMDFATAVNSSTAVELVVGDEDQVALPDYSQKYAAAVRARGVDARVSLLPGLGHNILQRPEVIRMASALIARVR